MKVCMDIGNVLVHVNLNAFTEVITKIIPKNHDPMLFLETIQALHDVGYITMRQALRDKYELSHASNDEVETLINVWNLVVERNEFMINFMKDLSSQGVRFALLSNMGHEHHEYLKKICPEIFELSEIHFLSYQVGARKPSRLFFKTFVEDYNSWGGSIYIDDRIDNLVASKQYAFRTIHFELDKQKSLFDLKKNTDQIKKIIFSHIPSEEIK